MKPLVAHVWLSKTNAACGWNAATALSAAYFLGSRSVARALPARRPSARAANLDGPRLRRSGRASGRPRPSRRERLAECELRQTANADSIVIATEGMSLTITLAPFALTWSLPDGRAFARERAAVDFLGKPGVRHAFARGSDDRFYGLGDKTGKLDLHGRRLRAAMLDSLGFDPEHGDPLYKHWPFLIARDGATGVASGLFYDDMAAATFDLGCEHDNSPVPTGRTRRRAAISTITSSRAPRLPT